MVRYYLRFGVLEYFLALWAEAGLNVASLAELVRMQRSTALDGGRNAGILKTVVAARCTYAGCIHAKS